MPKGHPLDPCSTGRQPAGVLQRRAHGALEKQQVAVEDQTEHYYVVNLLTLFSRSEALYEQTSEGARLKPLVVMLSRSPGSALGRRSQPHLAAARRCLALHCRLLAQSFARKLIDIDYHIAMGGRAYATLAETLSRGRSRVLGNVFGELAEKFQPLVDALTR